MTGASRGIGAGIAKAFGEQGYPVCIGYQHNREKAEYLSASLPAALPVQVDIEDRASQRRAIAAAKDHFGKSVAILVNNAAIAQEKPFFEITDDDWDRMLAINLRSNFSFAQEVLPEMINAGWGRVINISSIGGQWGGFNQVHYAAAKAGQISLTRSLAKLFSGSGVTSNAIAIGLAQTEMSQNELDSDAGKQKVANIPAGRLATIEEIAAAALFLASDGAGYMTGQTLNVNGGMYFT
ncbi:SDR family oxidoreductase [Marinobacteraceae bacterium S3BR75-40.1]